MGCGWQLQQTTDDWEYNLSWTALWGIGSTTQVVLLFGGLDELYLLDQRILGIAILFLLGVLLTVKRVATGSILDRPKGAF